MDNQKRKAFIIMLLSSICILFTNSCDKEMNRVSVTDVNLPLLVDGKGNESSSNYLGKNFYLNSTDGNSTPLSTETRSGNSDKILTRSFEVIADDEGPKYIGAHLMAALTDDVGTLQKVDVLVNGVYVGELEVQKPEWDFVTLKGNKAVNMSNGTNIITFCSAPPFYPEIDAVQIENNISELVMCDPQYEDYVAQLSNNRSGIINKLEQSEIESLTMSKINSAVNTRSAYDDSYSWQVTARTLDNPDGNYKHKVCVPITYTYHRKLSLTAGTYTFLTGPIEGDDYYSVDPVMYLYKIDDPHNYSYYSDDVSGRGRHSEISATVPEGDYYLVIRAYNSYYASTEAGKQGLVNVFQNGALLNSSCPVAGYVVDVDSPNTGSINYFTAYSTGLPQFFLEEKSSNKVKFFGDMYFYISPMEQMWYDDARMRLTKSSSTARYRMIITCVGALGAYYGNCDVYGSCQQVGSSDDVARAFPNLKINDAIYSSASSTNIYNCAAWAGGLTTGWMWGGIYSSQSGSLSGTNYGTPYVWTTWDNYFGNNPQRYEGATTYTRDGATASNSEVAVWSTNGSISGVTHFSCTSTANNHPHGYAWESKPGALRRVFHPRDALSGSSYGSIFAYYRDASKSLTPYTMTRSNKYNEVTSISFDESVRRGLTVIEDVTLSPEEIALFSSTQQTRSGNAFNTDEIDNLYAQWKEAVNSNAHISNPYMLIELPEGQELLSYCKDHKVDALAFFVNLYFIDSSNDATKAISQYMFCTIFAEYADIIEDIKKNWEENQYNVDGAYIAPLPETFLKKYAKELIAELI